MKVEPSSDQIPTGGTNNKTSGPMGSAAAADARPEITGQAQGSVAAQVTTGEASVQVAISDAASILSKPDNMAEFDAKKVEVVAKALADGTYKVNPEAIADKLIANAQELLSSAAQ